MASILQRTKSFYKNLQDQVRAVPQYLQQVMSPGIQRVKNKPLSEYVFTSATPVKQTVRQLAQSGIVNPAVNNVNQGYNTVNSVNSYLGLDRPVLQGNGLTARILDPMLRNARAGLEVANIPSRFAGGFLEGYKQSQGNIYQRQFSGGKTAYQSVLNKKNDLFESAPKYAGLNPNSFGGIALGLAAELATPDPMDAVRIAGKANKLKGVLTLKLKEKGFIDKAGELITKVPDLQDSLTMRGAGMFNHDEILWSLQGKGTQVGEFLKRSGDLRISNDAAGLSVELSKLPTGSQLSAIKQISQGKNIFFDISDNGKILKTGKGTYSDFLGTLKKHFGTVPTEEKAVRSFVEQGTDKTALKGLLTETPAQTSFRRGANLKITDVYKKTREIIDQFTSPNGIFKNIPPDKKVGILDYVRTPTRVLKKIGLENEGKMLKNSWEAYKLELPKELNKVNGWYEQVKHIPGSELQIFDYLDGNLPAKALDETELRVANEIKSYLKKWALRLNLPEESRIVNYISHIFEKGDIELEFNPEIAKMIEGRIPGSVYDPFLQQRIGKPEYVHDVWRALDAYVKRGTRKANMDPALAAVERASKDLDIESFKYVQKLTAGVNMRPTEIDNLLDNTFKSIFGYKATQRPTAYLTQKLRRWVYRGTLGLNVGSAVRNLTQSVNTYSKLGERWTTTGAFNFFRKALTGDIDELTRVGILDDSFVQDRAISALKRNTEKMDKGLFFFFDWAEKTNRGIAYYGAKARYLSDGLSEPQAIKKAKELVEQTQFVFGAVDTPIVLQSDAAKTLLQFQSFNIKQAEFIAEMVKNKEWAAMMRYSISSLALVGILGETLGYDIKDFIPFSGVLSGETKLGRTPPVQLGSGIVKSLVKAPDEYGSIPEGNLLQRLAENKDVTGGITAFIPGGVQAKKTFQGVQAVNQGASMTPTGRTRFEVQQTPSNYLKAVTLGQYSLPGAKVYFKNLGKSKAEVEYEKYLKLKESNPEQARVWAMQTKKENPTLYTAMKKLKTDKALEITTKEKQVRNLPVMDYSRARAIAKLLNKYPKGSQERKEYVKRLKALGVISDPVLKQLKGMKSRGEL